MLIRVPADKGEVGQQNHKIMNSYLKSALLNSCARCTCCKQRLEIYIPINNQTAEELKILP